jgi:hypothetical protein
MVQIMMNNSNKDVFFEKMLNLLEQISKEKQEYKKLFKEVNKEFINYRTKTYNLNIGKYIDDKSLINDWSSKEDGRWETI